MSKKILIGSLIVISGAIAVFGMQKMEDASQQIKETVDMQIQKIESSNPGMDIEYDKIKVNVDSSVEITGITFSHKPDIDLVSVGDLVIKDYDYKNKIPHFYDIELKTKITKDILSQKLSLSNNEEKELLSLMDKIKGNNENIEVVIAASQSYDEVKKSSTQEFKMDVQNAFGIEFSLKLDNFDMIKINEASDTLTSGNTLSPSEMQTMQLETFGQMTITELYFELENNGIVDILIAMDAKENGVNEDEYRKQLSRKMSNPTIHSISSAPIAEYLVKVEKFINKNEFNTIYLKINPEFENLAEGMNFFIMTAMQGGSPEQMMDSVKSKLKIEFDVK